MQIKNKKHVSWSEYLSFPIIPTLTYGFGKLVGLEYNNREFVWWIVIPILWGLYLCLHVEIVKKDETK